MILFKTTKGIIFNCNHYLFLTSYKSALKKLVRNMTTNKGYVLGVYETESNDLTLSEASNLIEKNDFKDMTKIIKMSGLGNKKYGKTRVFTGHCEGVDQVSVVSIGRQDPSENTDERIDESAEFTRNAVAAGVTNLKKNGVTEISVDPCNNPEAASEGAFLSLFTYEELKSKKSDKVTLKCLSEDAGVNKKWDQGKILAEAQNYSRYLMESPANIMTPTRFCDIAKEKFDCIKNVEVQVFDKDWAIKKNMGSFLSVAAGSDEPLKFLQVHYKGADSATAPIAIVGKGVTFDSGGISLKPGANMDHMRADMGGAACTVASVYAAAKLELKINVVGLMPLTENMPNGSATKPGDVVFACNGKSIQVDNTDAEGRLILADALIYSKSFSPKAIIDMATLTGACVVALGSAASAAYTISDDMYKRMEQAGSKSGDRVWRMPLFKQYSKAITSNSPLADLNNITSNREAGSCTAAAFLKEFVETKEWMHMDIAGVMMNSGDSDYLSKGMSGRPTRTIIEYLVKSQ